MAAVVWKQEDLDFVLVPAGMLILFAYHLFHIQRCVKSPLTTAIGYENHCRRAWVQRYLLIELKERGQALAVISANISAATSLASISLVLSSLIGAWIGSAYHNDYVTATIYGNTTATIIYIKYIALLSSFLVAFACFIQTVRCFINANFLMSTPDCKMNAAAVEAAVISGSNFWMVGLRALYVATNLLLWIFGPIPMFLSSVVTVSLLQYVDKNSNPPPVLDRSPTAYNKEMRTPTRVVSKTPDRAQNATPDRAPNGTPDRVQNGTPDRH